MKGKVLAIVIVLAVIVGLWYVGTVEMQKTTLQQSRERLTLIDEHIETGNLKAANSLLIQVEIDLRGIDKFYTPPSIKRDWRDLSNHRESLQKTFRERMVAIQEVFRSVTDFIKSGEFMKAQEKTRIALSEISDKDVTLVAMARYVDRLKVQDFKGADETIPELTANLSEELNVGEIANTLSELVHSERKANRESQARIASEVKSLADLTGARESYGFTPVLKGRAMIWDFTKNDVDLAYELLPDDLRASSREGIVTMFCIVKRENIERGRYSISNQPAYQEKMTIGVVYWPQKVSPGTAIVWGGYPPSSRPVRYSPEYGSAVNIKEWIEKLPQKENSNSA
jgi:hypothetical protein